MAKTIIQKIIFKNCTTPKLYELYMDEKKHSKVTGASAHIKAKVGSTFTAHDGYIKGINLQLIRNSLIVQSWRTPDWKDEEIDSTFILYFEQKGKNVKLQMVHANVPDTEYKNLSDGWYEYYWNPWKNHLELE